MGFYDEDVAADIMRVIGQHGEYLDNEYILGELRLNSILCNKKGYTVRVWHTSPAGDLKQCVGSGATPNDAMLEILGSPGVLRHLSL